MITLNVYRKKHQITAEWDDYKRIMKWLVENELAYSAAAKGGNLYIKFQNHDDALLCFMRFK